MTLPTLALMFSICCYIFYTITTKVLPLLHLLQFVRLKCICNKDSDFDAKARKMKARFVQRGYKGHAMDTAINKSSAINREQLSLLIPET